MLWKNTSQYYGWVSIFLHWFMALGIFVMFILGLYMVKLSYVDAWYLKAPHWHQSMGSLLFALLLFRVTWRLNQVVPVILAQGIEKTVALQVHRLHYAWMLMLMVSGYLISTLDGRGIEVFSWFEVPAVVDVEKGREEWAGWTHRIVAWGFMGFVGLHVLAVCKHHWVDHDDTFIRMIGLKKKENNK